MTGHGFVVPPYVMSEADARAGRGGVSYDTFDSLAKHHGINYEIKYTLNYVPVWVEDNSTDGSPGEVRFAILIPDMHLA